MKMLPTINPFASRYIRPDASPWCDHPSANVEEVWTRLTKSGYRGQIIGRHGSGKSTLLAELRRRYESESKPWLVLTIRDAEENQLRQVMAAAVRSSAETLVVVDGFEQLPWRRQLALAARVTRLIVTTHRRRWVGLPVAARLEPSLELAHQIVTQLLDEDDFDVSAATITNAYNRHNGNLREVFFELYDLCRRSGKLPR